MIKIICVFSLVLLIIGFSHESKAGDSEYQKNLKNNFENRIQNYLLLSIVPERNISLFDLRLNHDYQKYHDFFQKSYPDLLPLVEPPVPNNIYNIKGYSDPLKVYLGLPKYMQIRYDSVAKNEEELARLREVLNSIISNEKLPGNLSITDDPNTANLFLMPIKKAAFVFIKPPFIFSKRAYSDKGYGNILHDIVSTFYNGTLFRLNDLGLDGVYFSLPNGKIKTSYCPVDMGEKPEDISENIYLCVIQSQGLPGFHKIFQYEKKENIQFWGDLLLRLLTTCPAIEKQKSFFQIDFNNVFSNCLTEKDLENASDSFK